MPHVRAHRKEKTKVGLSTMRRHFKRAHPRRFRKMIRKGVRTRKGVRMARKEFEQEFFSPMEREVIEKRVRELADEELRMKLTLLGKEHEPVTVMHERVDIPKVRKPNL
jgi:hypothetical protein